VGFGRELYLCTFTTVSRITVGSAGSP